MCAPVLADRGALLSGGAVQLSIESNIDALRRDLRWFERDQMPFAVALAMNDVGKELIEANKAHMAEAFDRPTRWTLNAFHFRRATKSRPAITIERKLPARGRHYLEVQSAGGVRPLTGLEKQIAQRARYSGNVGYIAGPKVKRDGHGNMARGEMQRILSRIGAQGDAANNSTARSRKRAKGAGAYFLAKPGSRLKPGVYKRTGGSISRVLAFDTKAPTYRTRFRFDDVMNAKAVEVIPRALEVAIARALATARR